MKVYIITTSYYDFEDYTMNYSEVNGVFDTLDKAKEFTISHILEELKNDMRLIKMDDQKTTFKSIIESIKYRLNRFRCVYLKQEIGFGEALVSIIEKEVK